MASVFLSDWRVLLRRWYVTAGGLALTAALCVLATIMVPAQHQTTAEVLLLPPKVTGDLAPGQINNPYLSLGGLEGVTDVLARAMTDQAMARSLEERKFHGTYEVIRDLSSAAPLLKITVDDASPQVSLDTMAYLLGRVPPALQAAQLNNGVSRNALVVSDVLTRDSEPVVVRKSQIRALVVAGAFGLASTFVGAALLDGLLRARRRETGTDQTPGGPVSRVVPDRPLSGQPAARTVAGAGAAGRRVEPVPDRPPSPPPWVAGEPEGRRASGAVTGGGAGRGPAF